VQSTKEEVTTRVTGGSSNKRPVEYAYIYINSPQTRKQYSTRLKQFFDFIGLEGDDLEAR
jgi:hypothetical protein